MAPHAVVRCPLPLDDGPDRCVTHAARLVLAAVNVQMMLKVTGLAVATVKIAKCRAAFLDCPLQYFAYCVGERLIAPQGDAARRTFRMDSRDEQ